MLTGLGFLAVLGLAALLLPLWPTVAQQPPTADRPPSGFGIHQPPATDLEKARGDLERAGKELAKFKADLDKMLAEYELKTIQLKQALDAIKYLEKQPDVKKAPSPKSPQPIPIAPSLPPQQALPPTPSMAPLPAGNVGQLMMMEKRMANMEKKLDNVLRELQELRKQLDKKGVAPMGGSGAGGGGKSVEEARKAYQQLVDELEKRAAGKPLTAEEELLKRRALFLIADCSLKLPNCLDEAFHQYKDLFQRYLKGEESLDACRGLYACYYYAIQTNSSNLKVIRQVAEDAIEKCLKHFDDYVQADVFANEQDKAVWHRWLEQRREQMQQMKQEVG
jgi:hypothetical protein